MSVELLDLRRDPVAGLDPKSDQRVGPLPERLNNSP